MSSVSEFCVNSTLYAHFYRTVEFDRDEIVHRAILALVGKERGKYHVTKNNCEHFATEIVRGRATSYQTNAIDAGIYAGAHSSPIGAAVGAAGMVCFGMSSVTVAEFVTAPLWGSSLLGAWGLTQTTLVTSTVTAFQAGVVTLGTVTGVGIAAAILVGSIATYTAYSQIKESEKFFRSKEFRKRAQLVAKDGLKALDFDCDAINIAFCGGTGRGKSTCINAVLGSKAAAVSSSGEGTTQICKFELCMSGHKLVLYDLPGASTTTHPEQTYWADNQLPSFNVLVVFLEFGQLLNFERDLIQQAISA